MKRKTMRHLKRAVIVGIPIIILCAVSYVSFASLSEASETAFSYERYLGDKDSDKSTEDNNINENQDSGMSDRMPTEEDKTNPDSITVLVNKELPLPKDYIPADLVIPNVLFEISYFDEKKQMRAEAANALEELFGAAQKNGLALCAVSGYRSYQRQYDIFTANIRRKGLEHTLQFSAKPGYSEHQTGLSIDVSTQSVKYRIDATFAGTPEGKWLAENAYLFGYIIRYPEDKSEITGYAYEPWHIRYVGKKFAKYLYDNNLTIEEYYGFKPSIDYANEITYDNLVDFGIDMEDVIAQPATEPTKETEAATKTQETTEATKATEESTANETQDSSAGTDGGVKETQPQTKATDPTNSGGNQDAGGNGTSDNTNGGTTDPTTDPTSETNPQNETLPGSGTSESGTSGTTGSNTGAAY